MAHEEGSAGPGVQFLAAGEIPGTPQVNVTFSHAAEDGNSLIATTIQVRDGNVALAGYRTLHVWYGATANGIPSATSNTTTVTTGTIVSTLTANADYIVQTDSTGKAVVANIVSGAATRYLMVELLNTEVVASSVITWAA